MRMSVRIFAALGGFLFGYDTAVINGAMFQMKDEFGFSEYSWQAGLIVSIAIIGAFVGAFAAGFVSAGLGRRTCIGIADVFFTAGSIIIAVAPNVTVVLVGRAIVGLGIGLCSATIPIYLAEVTPASSRGATIVFNNVCLTGAQFIAAGVMALLVQFTAVNVGWRIGVAIGGIPSVIQLVGLLLVMPESPRWLLAKGRAEAAMKVAEDYELSVSELEDEEATPISLNYRALFVKNMRRRLLIGCMLHILQQTSGINTIMYYSAVILSSAGFQDPKSPVILSIPLAAINTIFSLFGVFTVDRWGRRLLLQISACGCFLITIGMTVIGFCLGNQVSYEVGGWTFLALLGVYLMFFAPGLGAMPWVVMGEIFPNHLRTSAASVATMCNWGANALVSQVFPMLIKAIGMGGTFLIICGCIFCAVLFIQFFVVETKGLTLEEIAAFFDGKGGVSLQTGAEPMSHDALENGNEVPEDASDHNTQSASGSPEK